MPINDLLEKIYVRRDGNAELLLAKYSPFPLFEPILSDTEAVALKSRLLTGDLSGKLSQFTRHDRVVKFCPKCIRADKQPYLRRKHQLRGYSVCLIHQTRLTEITVPVSKYKFFLDLDESFKASPGKTSFNELEVSVSKSLDCFSSTFRGLGFQQILDSLSQRYFSIHGMFGISESFNEFWKSLTGEEIKFHLFSQWRADTFVKRLSDRLFRVAAIQCYCEAHPTAFKSPGARALQAKNVWPRPVRVSTKKPSWPLRQSIQPRSRPTGSFPCLNPICSFYKKQNATIVSPGLDLLKWTLKCPSCGFTYESAIRLDRTPFRFSYRSAGPRLSELVRRLWHDTPWKHLKAKTGLSDKLMVLVAQELGLPLAAKGKIPVMVGKISRSLGRVSGYLEGCKARVTKFFAARPEASMNDLKKSPKTYISYRQLRYHEPGWLFSHVPEQFRTRFMKRRDGKWQLSVDVDESNTQGPSKG